MPPRRTKLSVVMRWVVITALFLIAMIWEYTRWLAFFVVYVWVFCWRPSFAERPILSRDDPEEVACHPKSDPPESELHQSDRPEHDSDHHYSGLKAAKNNLPRLLGAALCGIMTGFVVKSFIAVAAILLIRFTGFFALHHLAPLAETLIKTKRDWITPISVVAGLIAGFAAWRVLQDEPETTAKREGRLVFLLVIALILAGYHGVRLFLAYCWRR